jgi:hypothetical protein
MKTGRVFYVTYTLQIKYSIYLLTFVDNAGLIKRVTFGMVLY